MGKNSRPVGYGFRPTEEELANHYLYYKNIGDESKVKAIPTINVCRFEPWDISKLPVTKTEDPVWFFFTPNNFKYRNSSRRERATESGFWKSTGKDREIKCRRNVTVMKKSLVFHKGRAPGGEKTDWIIHEYRATVNATSSQGPFVLCRLFKQSSEKTTENSNCDKIEPTGSCSTTTNPSPNGMQSALTVVQMTLESDMQVGKQVESTENSHMTSDAFQPVDSHCNSYMTSGMEDHEPEGVLAQEDPQVEEAMRYLYVPRSPLQSDGTPSTIAPVQATLESNMQVRKQLEAIEKWLLDNSDNMPFNALPPIENSHMSSDMEDNKLEGAAVELRGDLGFPPLQYDGMPSTLPLVQATLESDMQVGKQWEGNEKLLLNNSDNMTLNVILPVECHCSSYKASHVEDHEQEGTALEEDQLLEELLSLFEPTNEQLDNKGYSPLQYDGTPSTLPMVQATLESDMQVGKQREGIEKFLVNSNNMTSNVILPMESHCSSYKASHMEDHEPEGTALEEDPDLEAMLRFFVPTNENLDDKIFSGPIAV